MDALSFNLFIYCKVDSLLMGNIKLDTYHPSVKVDDLFLSLVEIRSFS